MTTTEQPIQTTEAGDHSRHDTQSGTVPGLGPILDDPTLRVLAENVDDLENLRKASENRIRQLTRAEVDTDGEIRGHGLTEDHPNVVKLRASLDLIAQAEKMSVSNLERAMKDHPLGPWIKAQNGLGLKTTARLLSAIGDPYWNDLHNRPRTVSELWAYCGLAVHGGYAQKRTKGQVSNWSDTAKMRVWNMVQPIIKNRNSPYRHLYDQVKAGYVGAVYDERMAGKMFKGKPIEVGQPLSDGHIHARAQRVVMKSILKDLWIESKRIHEERADQITE
ncbi:hypothetical protein PBI_MORRISSEY_42 [Gordonia phage Morrissey]|nr:hypothetical protein PBI_MORRISSEY_42 [Gordonia phage Morrissey]